MKAPVNKKKQGRNALLASLGVGAGIIYLSLHVSKAWPGAESIDAVMKHALLHPFDIMPINTQHLGVAILVALVVIALMYQHYLGNLRQRPGEESGSAGWNESLKRYYKTYADTKKLALPKPKGKDPISLFLGAILKLIEDIFFGGTIKLNEDTGGDKSWEITEKKDENGKVVSKTVKHSGTRNMILTDDVVLDMNTRKTRRNNNIMVMGGSGTGKSRFMIKPNMLQANCSYVVTDPSGELLASMGTFLKERGYEVKVFNLQQMSYSNSYNPFHYIRDEKGVLSMITALIQNTTPKGSSKGDPFWEKSEQALLQAICFYLMEECNPEDQNFTNVMKLLRCADASEGNEDQPSVLDILFEQLEEKYPEHIGVRSYKIFKSAGGGKTAQSILISCQTRLQVFNLQEIHKLTGTDNIDLKSIGDRPTALFCIIPVSDMTYNFLVALLYTQLFETLYYHAETECDDIYHQGLRLPVPVRFMLDEFANIGTIPEFNEKLATMRKYGATRSIVKSYCTC